MAVFESSDGKLKTGVYRLLLFINVSLYDTFWVKKFISIPIFALFSLSVNMTFII